jgi:hypothetical protein
MYKYSFIMQGMSRVFSAGKKRLTTDDTDDADLSKD